MSPTLPHGLETLLRDLGSAGHRLAEMRAADGAAGNLSIFVRGLEPFEDVFPITRPVNLPQPVPELEGGVCLVTGSGIRLRDIQADPAACLAALVIDRGGKTARQYTAAHAHFERITSEVNSHLAVHASQAARAEMTFHAAAHAQPLHLTYLSHIPRYQEAVFLNRQILRWQPETIYHLPEGVGVLPFQVPGSTGLMASTAAMLVRHKIVLWARHGVMARSSLSVNHAVDRIAYAEVGAQYEVMNLQTGEAAAGLSPEEIRSICREFNIQQDYF